MCNVIYNTFGVSSGNESSEMKRNGEENHKKAAKKSNLKHIKV